MNTKPLIYKSLDDLLNAAYVQILDKGKLISSKRAPNVEITNYSATLSNPRARTSMSLDRKLVKSKFAEFAWYLSKDNSKDYITPYIKAYNKEEYENKKILGAYGPKIFGVSNNHHSQFERVVEQISLRKETKQAYISLSDAEDYRYRDEKYASPPCTIGLHFYVRENSLNLTTYMRSNDAYFGLPHDLFCFTMLQEMVSCRTNISLGSYTHIATSMHIYKKNIESTKQYIKEGYQEPVEMPVMKNCNDDLLEYISKEFDGSCQNTYFNQLDEYWKDYVLFSNRHFTPKNTKNWKNRFKNKTMKLIATNSLGK